MTELREPRLDSCTVEQRGSTLEFTVTGTVAHLQLECIAPDGRNVEVASTHADGIGRYTLDLKDFQSETPTTWSVSARFNGRPTALLPEAWSVQGLAPHTGPGGSVLPTLRRGKRPSFKLLAGPAAAPTPLVANCRIGSSSRTLRISADVVLPPHRVEHVVMALVRRGAGAETVRITPVSVDDLGSSGAFSMVRVHVEVPWKDLPAAGPESWLDVSIEISMPGIGESKAQLKAPRSIRGRLTRRRSGLVRRGNLGYFYEPRFTFKARAFTLYVTSLEWARIDQIRRLSRFAHLRRFLYRQRNRPLWLIGETPYKAQDTGLAFFRYVVQHHPEIDARYVIDEHSDELNAARDAGPIVPFGTSEHVEATLMAERIIGSHHPDYLYPLRTQWMRTRVKAILVFLQHGILGTKWMADLYGAYNSTFDTDLFLTSSPRERALVISDFGYRASRVKTTGLARFDTLLDGTAPQNRVLVIPSWRDWVRSTDDLENSEFLHEWTGLLSDSRFRAAVAGNEVVFIMHPNFRDYIDHMDVPGVTFLRQGEQSVQSLLKSSKLLITDYSSVGFDFALLHRPVVYFQFDRQRFLGARGSHLDLDADLPGDIGQTREAVVKAVERAVAADFGVTDDRAALADSYFPAYDRGSSERVFEAVKAAHRTRPHPWTARGVRAARHFAQRIRKSRLFPLINTAIFRTGALLPLDKSLVVFESGLGKSYGDSPKEIYQELKRSRPDLTFVWIANVRIPDADDRTTVVRRLSPKSFWYLARAKYWVNNQSFPSYLRRRRRQVFLQTWHGTPLKRMLYDLPTIRGRDAGYVDRATSGAAQWTVLTSPNPHTTAVMKSAFRHHARTLEVGYPRNDIFYADRASEIVAGVRKRLGIDDDKALVLFAPTFRDTALDGSVPVAPTAAIDMERFAAMLGDRAVLVLRRHVLDTARATIPAGLEHAVIDATSHPNVQELLLAADVLITDYSSLYFDFLNTRRPCIFFAPDLAEYRDEVRGFYLDYGSDLPGPVVETDDELFPVLAAAVDEGTIPGFDMDRFAALYCPDDDGQAAARVVADVFGAAVRG